MAFATADDLVTANIAAKAHRVQTLMFPEFWSEYASPLNLTWNRIKFGESPTVLPDDKIGVYCFVIESGIANLTFCGILAYVGRARNSFRERYSDYLTEKSDPSGRPKVVMMLNQWENHLGYYYAILSTKDECTAEERRLLAAFVPPFSPALPAGVQARSGAF